MGTAVAVGVAGGFAADAGDCVVICGVVWWETWDDGLVVGLPEEHVCFGCAGEGGEGKEEGWELHFGGVRKNCWKRVKKIGGLGASDERRADEEKRNLFGGMVFTLYSIRTV